MKKKKKNKSIIIIILITIIFIVSIYFIMKNINNFTGSNEAKLKKIGYSKDEITLILKNEEYLDYALNNDYNTNYIKLISTNDFKIELLDEYLTYLNDNKDAPIEDIVYLINNDIKHSYSLELMKLVKAKYFLITRLDRYINYLQNNSSLEINEIVKRVNSDIDFAFYSNIVDSDLSLGNLLICNKHYKLSSTYSGNLVYMSSQYSRRNGAQLDSTAYEAFKKLSDDARSQGLNIVNQSAYRSYSTQEAIYNSYLNSNGLTWTDKWSARPGHSEHQTGLALDVATYTTVNLGDFEYTNEFTWMQENAYKYGFILRYPDGQEYITGYGYEPWHYRYVGVEAATTIYNENITYEEYYSYYVIKK